MARMVPVKMYKFNDEAGNTFLIEGRTNNGAVRALVKYLTADIANGLALATSSDLIGAGRLGWPVIKEDGTLDKSSQAAHASTDAAPAPASSQTPPASQTSDNPPSGTPPAGDTSGATTQTTAQATTTANATASTAGDGDSGAGGASGDADGGADLHW